MKHAPAFAISNVEYRELVRDTLRDAFGNERHAAKRLADAANTNERTARNWLDGISTPTGIYHVRLLAIVPEYQSAIRRLAAMDADLDPEFDREFTQLVQLYLRRRERV